MHGFNKLLRSFSDKKYQIICNLWASGNCFYCVAGGMLVVVVVVGGPPRFRTTTPLLIGIRHSLYTNCKDRKLCSFSTWERNGHNRRDKKEMEQFNKLVCNQKLML